MAKTKSFLQEAVVAAKEVREAAIQHAYKELEENLTPSIKEALAQKLEEDLEIEGLDENANAMSGFKPVKEPKKKEIKEEDDPEDEPKDEDPTEDEPKDDEPAEDPEEDTELPDEPADEEDPEPAAEDDAEDAPEDEEPSDDTELKDLTVGQLKDLVSTIVSAIAPERPAEQPEDMTPADVQGQGEEDTPIEPAEEPAATGDEEPLPTGDEEAGKKKDDDEEDIEIDLNELLKELESEEHDRKVVTHKEDAEFQKELDEVKQQRDDALATIEEMKETLRSTNLLNAKLSSTVKLLSKPLSESQRVRTIKALDEAQSVKEVKAIYRTLVESFNSEAKTGVIKEHKMSTASRVAGKSTAAPVVEVDPVVRRFQELAGIK